MTEGKSTAAGRRACLQGGTKGHGWGGRDSLPVVVHCSQGLTHHSVHSGCSLAHVKQARGALLFKCAMRAEPHGAV